MISLQSVAGQLGISESWIERAGAHWLEPGSLTPLDLAVKMNSLRARFVTITAYELPAGDGFRLEYHWDLDGRLLGFPFSIPPGNSIASIVDSCEAADWIEREIHEEYAIDFLGREYEPLLLREGDSLGVNLREAPAPAHPASGAPHEQEAAR